MKKLVFLLVSFVTLLSSYGSNDSNVVNILSMPLTIDYSKSIEQLVKEGNYNSVNSKITTSAFIKNEVTPTDTIITREAILLNFNRSMTSEDVVAQMKSRGLHPATASELYSLNVRYPIIQREISIIPIVALGSLTADSSIPVVWKACCGYCDASLWNWYFNWNSNDWFLAFRD